jgi:endonuclease/exonuclease/phosphatase (EEP) superfamily protein YafD
VQYAGALFVLLLYCIWRRLTWLAVAVAVCVAINLAPIVRYYQPVASAGDTAHRLRVVTLNLWASNSRHDLVERFLRAERPDVVFLSEVSKRWRSDLRPIEALYPYRLPPPGTAGWPIALLSKWPIREFDLTRLGTRQRPTIIATVCPPTAPSDCVRIVGLHTDRPQCADLARSRNTQLGELARILSMNRDIPTILLGDLNLTPWSPYFAEFLSSASLRDSGLGLGLHPTWMSRVPPFGLVIDHILVSEDVAVVGRHVGPQVGSDHFPVIADLAY